MNDWNSALYLKFESQRGQAAQDLLDKIPLTNPKTVVDLGCGPGTSLGLLSAKFPRAKLTGVDHSQNMLQVARRRLPMAKLVQADIATWHPPAPVDLIFANAALQFVPNHHQLLPILLNQLQPEGCLAVQMPDNVHETSHALMRMIAADGPWAERLVPIAKTRAVIGPLEDYYNLLAPHCRHVSIWQTIYVHAFENADGIVEWFEGSPLRPFLAPLSKTERTEFLTRYRQGLVEAYRPQPNGKILLRYPRMFFIAVK